MVKLFSLHFVFALLQYSFSMRRPLRNTTMTSGNSVGTLDTGADGRHEETMEQMEGIRRENAKARRESTEVKEVADESL